jgi:hypothetical protein
MSRVRRWLLVLAGVISAGLGALGAVLPGLPTTVFLLLASYCFARSCPWLEQRLLRNRLFAPYMAYIDGGRPLSRKAKATAIASVWIAVSISLALLYSGGGLQPWFAIVAGIAAIVGTFAIWTDMATRMLRVPDRPADAQ